MKKIILTVIVLFLISLIVAGSDQNDVEFDYNFSDLDNLVISVKSYGVWNEFIVKYGFVGEGSEFVYSSELQHDFNISIEEKNISDYDNNTENGLKFSIGTSVPNDYLGFFYEFLPEDDSDILWYYENYHTFFNPNKYHITLSDLFENFNDIVIIGNKTLVYVNDSSYYVFDPGILGNGIPTECIVNFYDYYNLTFDGDNHANITVNEDFKMGGKYTYSGDCSDFVMRWYDDTTEFWDIIPASDTDLDCNGANCYKTNPTSGTWYYKYPECESLGNYAVRMYLRYKDHDDVTQEVYKGIKYIDCIVKGVYANESVGRNAIETGINQSLTNPSIFTDQQLYTINRDETHQIGSFDKVAIEGNQTWGFNYITGSETYTNMTNLDNTVIIWENESLTYDQIVWQVGNLINNTKES